jgi:4-carboxymuconolactone decarboxylase
MSVLKYSPEMSRRAIPLFNYVRNESSLPQKVRELAMLITARAKDCPYIWNAHVALGRQAGLSSALIDALRDRKPLPPMTAEESAVVRLGMEFFQTNRVSQETFDLALAQFGPQGLVELTTLMGFYAMLAFNANTVDLGLPPELTEPPLPV